MVAPSRCVRKPLRLKRVPLPEDHPDWLELDRAVATDHLARRIRCLVEQVDLSALFASFVGVGSAVTPPDLLLQVVLFQIHRQELAPAVWFRDSRDSIPVRWLLRGLRPARSVFYRFRAHLPLDLVDTLNQQILLWAQDEGHTSASAAALDGTFHAAAGSRHHLLNLEGLEQRCGQLDARAAPGPAGAPAPPGPPAVPTAPALLEPTSSTDPGAPHDTPPAGTAPQQPAEAGAPPAAPPPAGEAGPLPPAPPGWMAGSAKGRQRQRRRYQQARQTLKARLADHDKKQRRQRKVKRRAAEQVKICPSEPEAVLGKDKMKVFRPLYNTQIVQDVDSPFVLGYGVYPRVSDAGLLPPMLERTRQLTGRALDEVLVDGMYARLLDVRYCVAQGTRMYAPLPAPGQPKRAKGKAKAKGKEVLLGKEEFTWLAPEQT